MSEQDDVPSLLEADHPIVRAQQSINAALFSSGYEATVAGEPTDTRSWLADLTSLTRAIVLLAATPSRTALLPLIEPEDQDKLMAHLPVAARPRREPAMRQLSVATKKAGHFASCAALALDLLNSDDIDHLRTRMERLPTSRREAFHTQVKRNAGTSALIRALGGRSSVARALVAARSEAIAKRPASGKLILACNLPARPFPSLLERHVGLLGGELAAAAAAMALLGWPAQHSLADCASLLGIGHLGSPLLDQWARLAAADANLALFHDIVEIRALLVTEGSPIDYERRRRTFDEPVLLADRVIRPVATEVGASLTQGLVRYVSFFVYERLSGSDALLSARGSSAPGAFRMRFRRLRKAWHEDEPAAMTALVEAALLRHRINEPVLWQPRFSDGSWTHPEPDYTRTLAGWNNRDLRSSSRHRTPGRLRHATLEQIIDFAFEDPSSYAWSLAQWLCSAAVLGLGRPGARASRANLDALAHLANHVGRPLVQPTAVDPRRPIRLTSDGAVLITGATDHIAALRERLVKGY